VKITPGTMTNFLIKPVEKSRCSASAVACHLFCYILSQASPELFMSISEKLF
jgi:hypothetical protein